MKRTISLLLCLCMLLALSACGNPGAVNQTTEPTQAGHGFLVGYAKVNITPKEPTGLYGYGNTSTRLHDKVLDDIYLTCVAVTDAQEKTVLLYAMDLGDIDNTTTDLLRAGISKATGIPGSHMMFNASHTHSAPDAEGILFSLHVACVRAAQEALTDRKEAQMFFGTSSTSGISFVRHYYKHDGSVVTDNHGDTAAVGDALAGHTTQVDEEMRILQFKRDGGKDVILANWQCHPHLTGGFAKYSLSADIVGMFRTYMEQDLDCLVAYYQGGAGNLNPQCRIFSEEANRKRDYKVHGQLMAQAAKNALQNMIQVETGAIQILTQTYTCQTNREDADLLESAMDVIAYYNQGHTPAETKIYAESFGIASLYHAFAIRDRQKYSDTFDIEINALCFGEFAWTFAPFEMFDATAKYIRENSPFAYNFVSGYTNGYYGYFPTQECWAYGAYEVDTTKVAPKTAEAVADRLVEMLSQLNGISA